MKRIFDSDSDPTMIANQQFNEILKQIQTSGLNFQLQISPFGAVISMKKSLVKDKKGSFIIPSSIISGTSYNDEDYAALTAKNLLLEKKLAVLENKSRESVVDECKAANKVVEAFETEINVLEKNMKNETVKQSNCGYGNNLSERVHEMNMNRANENVHYEMDLNYNVKVSNPFSPLLQLESACDSHQTPNSRTSAPRPFGSPHTPSRTPPSQTAPPKTPPSQTPSCQQGCFESSHPTSYTTANSAQTDEAKSESSEAEKVLFEGKLINKQDAFKKIIEAVKGMHND